MTDAAITGIPEVDSMTPSQAFHAGRKSAAAEIDRLRAALKPFAKFADQGRYVRWRDCIPGAPVYVKDAERAAEALNQQQRGEK